MLALMSDRALPGYTSQSVSGLRPNDQAFEAGRPRQVTGTYRCSASSFLLVQSMLGYHRRPISLIELTSRIR